MRKKLSTKGKRKLDFFTFIAITNFLHFFLSANFKPHKKTKNLFHKCVLNPILHLRSGHFNFVKTVWPNVQQRAITDILIFYE